MQDAVESSRTSSVSLSAKKHNPLTASRSVPPKPSGGAKMIKTNVDPYTDEREYTHH